MQDSSAAMQTSMWDPNFHGLGTFPDVKKLYKRFPDVIGRFPVLLLVSSEAVCIAFCAGAAKRNPLASSAEAWLKAEFGLSLSLQEATCVNAECWQETARLHSELWLPVLLVAAEVNPPSLTAAVVANYAASCNRRLRRANKPGKVLEAPGRQRIPQLATCRLQAEMDTSTSECRCCMRVPCTRRLPLGPNSTAH